ncbi:MAG TPA: hypothetical protein VIV12_14100, partial [Streptosporangiaceae bacterium]
IANGIVEAHGGSIELQRLHPGTRFRIRLPIEAAERLSGGADPRDDGQDSDPVSVAADAAPADAATVETAGAPTLATDAAPAARTAGTVGAPTLTTDAPPATAAGTVAAPTLTTDAVAAGAVEAETVGAPTVGAGRDVGAAGGTGP